MSNKSDKNITWKNYFLPLGVLLASGIIANLSSQAIATYFPDRQAPQDLMFRILPYISATQYLTDIMLIVMAVSLFIYARQKKYQEIPKMIFAFGMAELIRAFIILLTPLGGPLGNGAYYGLIHVQQNGEFPSGHTMVLVLSYLIVDKARAPKIKTILLIATIVEIASLLLSHGHYSIDIVGGILLAYFVFHEFWLKSKYVK